MESDHRRLEDRFRAVTPSAPDETRLLMTDFHRRGFPQESWRAIYVWKFRVVTGGSDTPSILRSMLGDDAYAYTFMSPYPECPKQDARGPYILSRLSSESFLPVSRERVWSQLDEFFQRSWHSTSRSDLGIDELVGTAIDDADELFELQEDKSDHRELAWIVADEFREFVAINRMAQSVSVVVTSED